MNLFAVGFPISMLLGFVVLGIEAGTYRISEIAAAPPEGTATTALPMETRAATPVTKARRGAYKEPVVMPIFPVGEDINEDI